MKKIAITITVFVAAFMLTAFSPAPQKAEAPTWSVDKGHSSVVFSVRHFCSDVVGSFDDFDGEIKFDPDDLATSSISFTVQVGSVNTKNERRDGHLQSADFFNAEQWPTMKFESTSISKKKKKGSVYYLAKGKLTVRDVTKEIEIPVNYLGSMENTRRKGSYVGGFNTEFMINRNDYGVGTGDWAATTTIGDEVKITVNVEVRRSDS
ncbi:MAG: YceI family protein [Bacteroidetes bacterium]|nr:YceI family protein [Bacteroidota bacterium]